MRAEPKSVSIKQNPRAAKWISFAQDGVVQVFVGKVELGQGIRTVIAQIAADRLVVTTDRIRIAEVNTRQSPQEGLTASSLSVQHSGGAVSSACRTIKARALELGAERLGVDVGDLAMDDGRIMSHAGPTGLSYWSFSAAELLDFELDDEALSAAEKGAYVGTSVKRFDLPDKIFGKPSFIHDIYLPDMLFGRVVRKAGSRARLKSVNTAALLRFAGIKIVQNGSFLGVLSPKEYDAVRAATVLANSAVWDQPSQNLPDCDSLEDFLMSASAETTVVDELMRGRRSNGSRTFVARYSRPYLAHASIGPSCAIAHWRDGRLDVWTHSQGIFGLKDDLTTFLRRTYPGIASDDIVVHHADGAGSYGHNPADDVAFDAVLLAMEAEGRPVKLQWSRADELGQGPFGPSHVAELKASTDENGRIIDWSHEVWSNGYTSRPGRGTESTSAFLAGSELDRPFNPIISNDPPLAAGGGSERNAIPLYDFPCWKITKHRVLEMPIRVSSIRSLGAYANVFATESFIDEIARELGCDPITFRLAHLSCPRSRDVIEAAVAKCDWWKQPKLDDEGRGFAFSRYKNTGAWCAVAARVKAGAEIRVLDLSIAVDVGAAINPDGVCNQIEGGALQSCSWTLHEAVQFTGSEITSISWENYPILQFTNAPRVVVTIVSRPFEPSLGAGEASQGPVAAALGNAVFDALGVRVRKLPLSAKNIIAASDQG